MPQRTLPCQLGAPTTPDSRRISPTSGDNPRPQTPRDTHTTTPTIERTYGYSAGQAALVHGVHDQSVSHTLSRKSGPRRWRRAVEWLIAAGLHPRANATTMRVAEDLADRMDYDTGHVRYCLKETADRLGMSEASLKRHVKYLRELGALAWVQRGTRSNIRRLMGLKGYAATATVYAAVIPPVYDHAMGHTIVGTGYQARIIVDLRNRQAPVDNPPVDNAGHQGLEPPSLVVVKKVGQVQMGGGFNYTSQATRDHESPTQPSKNNRSSSKGTGRHALQVAKDIRIARQVRPLVNWTQREGLRRLAFALRPLIDQGLDSYAIADRLNGMCSGMRWQPKAPASYIRTVLADHTRRDRQRTQAEDRYKLENPVQGPFRAAAGQYRSVMAAVGAGLARYQATARARGLEDLNATATKTADYSDADAAADMAAFLGGTL